MRLLLILYLLISLQILKAQPYNIRPKTEIPVFVTSLVTGGVSLYLEHQKKIITSQELENLNPNKIPFFDKYCINLWSLNAQKSSDLLMLGSVLLPSSLLLLPNFKHQAGTVAIIYSQTFIANYALTNLIKQTVKRKRPFVYNPTVAINKKIDRDANASFYSGHTSTTAAMCFLGAKMFADYYPSSNAKPYIWTAAAIIPAITGYLRIKGGKHYTSDVVVGYISGAGLGLLIPSLHKKNK